MRLGLVVGTLAALVCASAEAGQTAFRAQDGEIDVAASTIATGAFGARRDSIPGWHNWTSATTTEIAYLGSSDDRRYRNQDAGSGDNSAMIFEYRFDDDRAGVERIDLQIELSQAYAAGRIYVFIWDWDAGRYDVLGSMSGTSDRTLSYRLEEAPARYLNVDGQLTVFVVNQDDYGTQAYIKVDRIAVEVIAPAAHFSIEHDGSISTCDRAKIVVEKHRADHAIDADYVGKIVIDASTGQGSWSLVRGNGELQDDGGGSATYAFARDDGGRVELGFSHSEPAKIDFNVTDGSEDEASSEDEPLGVSLPGVATVRDAFAAYSYAGNDGTENWVGPWLEIGESNGVGANHVSISGGRCVSSRCLRIGTDFTNRETFHGRGARRAADLSRATSATLSFQYMRGYVRGTGKASVAISRNGGASFTTLATYTLNGNTTTPISQSFDISDWATADTQVRFLATVENSTTSIYIDNVQIRYATACPEQDYFVVEHDGAGIHCLDEPFRVTAMSEGDVIREDFAEWVTLSTSTGAGTFANGPGNAGSFADPTPNDGLASYRFAVADGGRARFFLNYAGTGKGDASKVDIDVAQSKNPASQDDDREGLLAFDPAGFQLTAHAIPDPPPLAISDPIRARVAGRAFRVHIAAYGTSSANPECGVVESYSDGKAIEFWSEYVDPASGTRAVAINTSSIGRSEAAATPVKLEFIDGRAVFGMKYKDVGRIRLHAKDPGDGVSGNPISGASDAFVSMPAEFRIGEIQRPDGSGNPGTSAPKGEVFVAAGAPFRAAVRVLDAEGALTPNFGRESAPEGLRLRSAELVAPKGGRNGPADDGAIENATGLVAVKPAGTFSGSAFAFGEVGAIRLQATVADGDYLGAGDVKGGMSEIVGRFTPSRFEVKSNAPEWDTACDLGAFTWAGQPFGYVKGGEPRLGIRAVNASGTTTQNYAGDWWRLANDSIVPRRYVIEEGTLDERGLPSPKVDPVIEEVAPGEGLLSFSAGSGLVVSRSPLFAPFEAEIELSIGVVDRDGVAYPGNPFRFGEARSGKGMAFDVSKRIQLGRIRIENAAGSELVDLPTRLVAQVYDGTRFVDDTNDSCSRIREADLDLTPSPGGLVSNPDIAHQPFMAGDGGLVLSAPNRVGSLDVVVDLGATGANLPWLRFDWPEDGNLDGLMDDDPRAHFTFGIWPGRPGQIYQREVY